MVRINYETRPKNMVGYANLTQHTGFYRLTCLMEVVAELVICLCNIIAVSYIF